MIRLKIVLGVALLAFVAACQQTTAPGFTLDFTAEPLELLPGTEPDESITAKGGQGTIVVRGVFATPCYTDELKAVTSQDGQEIALRIRSVSEDDECLTAVRYYRYQARLLELDPGSYLLRVIHDGEASENESVVLRTTIEVR